MAKKGHSVHFELVKKYYDNGRWSVDRVRRAVVSEWISEEEFKEITGEDY